MINLKLRFQNKVTLVALLTTTISFVYTLLSMLGIAPAIAESDVQHLVYILVEVLVTLGIVTDPSTKGLGDSTRVMGYTEPRADTPEGDYINTEYKEGM